MEPLLVGQTNSIELIELTRELTVTNLLLKLFTFVNLKLQSGNTGHWTPEYQKRPNTLNSSTFKW